MTNGKAAKRRRRVQAPPVRTPARRRQASPRVLIGACIIVVGLGAAGALLGVGLSGGSSKADVPARGSVANALPGASDVQRQLEGIPQHGNVLGSPSAPVTLVEYIDLQCPYCRQFETEAMPALLSRYVRAGELKVEARIVAFLGPDSERGRTAAIAAGQQSKLFNFTQLLYFNQGIENSGWLDDDMVTSAAASIPGLDVPRLLSGRSSATTDDQARTFDSQEHADGVTETPTILVGKSGAAPRQVTLASPSDVQSVAAAIRAALG